MKITLTASLIEQNSLDFIQRSDQSQMTSSMKSLISFSMLLIRIKTAQLASANSWYIILNFCAIYFFHLLKIFNSANHVKMAFALTSRGDPRKKLEYAFDLYDSDKSGTLNSSEIREVLVGMLDLLGIQLRTPFMVL